MIPTNQPPADTIRYGGLKAVIWRNEPKNDDQRVRYTVNYIRSYKNSTGDWKDTTSLSEVDNLKLGHLVPKVADRVLELQLADRENSIDNGREAEEAA